VIPFLNPIPEQQAYARDFLSAIKASPSWKDHVSYSEPGTWEGLTDNAGLLLSGIVVVVNDTKHPPGSALVLQTALKKGGIDARLKTCECSFPPKPQDIWLFVGEKHY
jgi:hypothetical protein